MKDLEGKLKG